MTNPVRSATVRLTMENAQYLRAIKQTADQTESAARRIQQAGDRSSKSVALSARRVTAAASALGVGKLITDAVHLESTYSKTMAQVGVATGAAGEQVKELDRAAIEMGQSTIFSANESAQAMLQLAKGGLKPAAIEGGALKNTLVLAAAGGLQLNDAADSVVSSMGAFRLGAKDTGAAVAALAGAANASSAEVSDMVQALAQTGTSARAAGLTVQETTAVLAAFAQAGIKGSDAGTSFKVLLQNLVPQTDAARREMERLNLSFVDNQGNFVGAQEIAGRLKRALAGLSEAQRSQALTTIFGSDAQRAANVLATEGAAGIGRFQKQTSDLSQAQKLAKASMSGTAGALEQMRGAAETAELELGRGLAPTVQEIAGALANFVSSHDLEKWGRQAGQSLEELLREAQPLAQSALPALGDAASTVRDILKATTPVVSTVLDVFNALPDPVRTTTIEILAGATAISKLNAATGGLGPSLAQIQQFRAEMTYSATRMDAVERAAYRFGGTLRTVGGAGGMVLLSDGLSKSNAALSALETGLGGAAAGFAVGGPVGAAVGGLGGLFVSLAKNTGKAGDAARKSIGDWRDYASTLDQVTGATTAATRAAALERLQHGNALGVTRAAGLDDRQVVNAVVNGGKARKNVVAALQAEKQALDANVDAKKAEIAANERIATDNSVPLARQSAAAEAVRTGRQELAALEETNKGRKEAIDATLIELGAVDKAVAAKRHEIAVTTELAGKLKGIPRDKRLQIKAEGIIPTTRGVADLARKLDLTPKQIKTVIAAAGVPTTLEAVQKVINRLNAADQAEAHPKVVLLGTEATLGQLARIASEIKSIPRQWRTDYYVVQHNAIPKRGQVADAQASGNGADGATVPKTGLPYADRHLYMLADGEEIISNRHGQADRFRADRAAGRIPSYAGGGTTGAYSQSYQAGTSVTVMFPSPTYLAAAVQAADAVAAANARSARSQRDIRQENLDILHTQQQIRDLTKQLHERNKKGKLELRGLDRTVAKAELADLKASLKEIRDETRRAAAEELASRRKDATDALTSAGDVFARGTTPTSAIASVNKAVAEISEYGQVMSQLRAAKASPALLQQLINRANTGDFRSAIRLGRALLAQPATLAQLNASLTTLGAVSSSVATMTTDPRFLAGGAWNPTATRVVQVNLNADPSAMMAELTRVITFQVNAALAGATR